MTISENNKTSQKIYRGEHFTMILHSIGIIELIWTETVHEVTLKIMEDVANKVGELGEGKRMPVFVATKPFMSLTDEARKFVASDEGQRYTMANATLVDNLGKRILYNFFIKFTKMPTPIKAFKTREDAFEWLEQFIEPRT
ncbi:MAG: hypothetical protein IPM74_00630 [Crocinitomicaceae bacterium]|nr:hypothetical protein [Crocinitomicaceae bacterium]MBK8924423.1 hypothetical protein [Crocinitomicaceae bacterium]